VEQICAVIGFGVSTCYAGKKRAVQPSDREVRDAELIPLLPELEEHKGKQLY
jgi:hypothetical protein